MASFTHLHTTFRFTKTHIPLFITQNIWNIVKCFSMHLFNTVEIKHFSCESHITHFSSHKCHNTVQGFHSLLLWSNLFKFKYWTPYIKSIFFTLFLVVDRKCSHSEDCSTACPSQENNINSHRWGFSLQGK